MSLVEVSACGGEAVGVVSEPAVQEDSTSLVTLDPTQWPTTGVDTGIATSTVGGSTGGETAETTASTDCGDGIVEADEECDEGPENGAYAACTDECEANVCGDGKVLVGVEECDEGAANVDSGYCRSDCRLNVCGDRFVFFGVEECDLGADNGPDYGGCDDACTINRCGDGELDVGHEQCDAGAENGSDAPGEEGMAGCDEYCGFAGRRLFLSSKLFTGDLGSRAGADLACQAMAADAMLVNAEKFRALLADSKGSPNSFLGADASGLPFIAPSGLVLAANYDELIAVGPNPGIVATEKGDAMQEARVWTNVGPTGDAFLEDLEHTCVDWTSDDPANTARVGLNAVGEEKFMQWQAEHQWVSYATRFCSLVHRIYCVEAP